MTDPTTGPPPRRTNTVTIAAVAAGAVAVLVILGLVVFLVVSGDDADQAASPSATSQLPPMPSSAPAAPPPAPERDTGQLPEFTAGPQLGANCQYPASKDAASKPVDPPRTGKVPTEPATVSASMATDRGNIGLMLDNAQAPCTVNSFASLAQQGFFDGTPCHRLTTSPSLHVLQCGDPNGTGTGGPGYEFADEYPTDQYPFGASMRPPVTYPRGTLAMANAGPNTNGSQFFLVYADSELPPAYTVFGTIDDTGLDTLDTVAAAGVVGGGQDGEPATEVTITSVRLD